MRPRRIVLGLATLSLVLTLLPAGIGGAAPVAVTSLNMEWRTGLPAVTGSSMDFFERIEDGDVRRYAAVSQMGYGVVFVDITDPLAPTPVGFHASPGINYHADVHVNVDRDIMVFNVDFPGTNLAMGLGTGIEFVDISDLSAPERLSVVQGLEGPHKIALVGDHHVYTTLPTYVIDYSDPRAPVDLGRVDEVCAHGVAFDATAPDIAYHASCQSWKWQIVDVSDPVNPRLLTEVRDVEIETPHDAIPTPDSSIVAISDLAADYFETQCPGGGLHFYDLEGRFASGASPDDPVKLGTWFAPYTGARNDPAESDPYGSCTLHGFQMNPERPVIATGNYMGGAWLVEVDTPTEDTLIEEYSAEPDELGRGPTTWGRTIGGHVSVGDFTWYLKWAPFDDPAYERLLFSVSPTNGFEVFEFTGELPPKLSHLTVGADRTTITGRLGRYPLQSVDGPVSRPLADQVLEVTVGDRTATVATQADGTYAADLGLPSGTYEVAVRWAGDDDFRQTTTTQTVEIE